MSVIYFLLFCLIGILFGSYVNKSSTIAIESERVFIVFLNYFLISGIAFYSLGSTWALVSFFVMLFSTATFRTIFISKFIF